MKAKCEKCNKDVEIADPRRIVVDDRSVIDDPRRVVVKVKGEDKAAIKDKCPLCGEEVLGYLMYFHHWDIELPAKGGFVQVPRLFLESYAACGLSPQEMMYLILIASYRYSESEYNGPGQGELARKMGFSTTHIKAFRAKLQEHFGLKVEERRKKLRQGVENFPNVYHLGGVSCRLLEKVPLPSRLWPVKRGGHKSKPERPGLEFVIPFDEPDGQLTALGNWNYPPNQLGLPTPLTPITHLINSNYPPNQLGLPLKRILRTSTNNQEATTTMVSGEANASSAGSLQQGETSHDQGGITPEASAATSGAKKNPPEVNITPGVVMEPSVMKPWDAVRLFERMMTDAGHPKTFTGKREKAALKHAKELIAECAQYPERSVRETFERFIQQKEGWEAENNPHIARVNKLFDDLWQEPAKPQGQQFDAAGWKAFREGTGPAEFCQCKQEVEAVEVKRVVISGRQAIQGKCPQCGGKVLRFVKGER